MVLVCTLSCLQAVSCVTVSVRDTPATHVKREIVSVQSQCVLYCLQAVTVTGRVRPTAHVWRVCTLIVFAGCEVCDCI